MLREDIELTKNIAKEEVGRVLRETVQEEFAKMLNQLRAEIKAEFESLAKAQSAAKVPAKNKELEK